MGSFLATYSVGLVLLIAAGLDYGLGDPRGWLHPVQIMGWSIDRFTRFILQFCKSPLAQRLVGVGLGLGLIVGSGVAVWAIVALAKRIQPIVGIAVESILLASCFAGRSLRNAAEDVLEPLEQGDLNAARSRLRNYVGRDTEQLSEPEILRAILETVTENATDGVLAPLFYGLLGAAIPGVGAVPLAMAYKAASTLDSTIGYRTAPYTYLGWFSARFEDGLTWVPCRLVVLTLALLSGKPRRVWQICQRDAPQDPSPNSGWSECVYAAILGVQVGGMNWYRGVAKPKPLLGEPLQSIHSSHIRRSLQLTRITFLLWLVGAIVIWLLVHQFGVAGQLL
jgi:adenosylcobinamide-phosphate synthase